jgi:phosphopantetheinyl transferase
MWRTFAAVKSPYTLRALPAQRQRLRFFEYWTFKESYIKARGTGLSIPLDQFWFHLPDDRDVVLGCGSGEAGNEARWLRQFHRCRSTWWLFVPKYALSLPGSSFGRLCRWGCKRSSQ